jgi:hypothetical protein
MAWIGEPILQVASSRVSTPPPQERLDFKLHSFQVMRLCGVEEMKQNYKFLNFNDFSPGLELGLSYMLVRVQSQFAWLEMRSE